MNTNYVNFRVANKPVVYTIEFQKRGLPHAHMLMWLQGDQFISAEMPEKTKIQKVTNW